MDKLPDSLDEQQKRSKIRNLTYELAHRTNVIVNITGARGSAARWTIRSGAQAENDTEKRSLD